MASSGGSRNVPHRPGRAVTLQRVADHAGVSIATASRVLHGGGGRAVGEELRARVLAAAAELNYTPNAPAQALARARTSVVGLIVHDIGDPYFAAIATGVMKAAREHDLMVMVAATFRDPRLELEYLRRLHDQRARAVLLCGSGFADREFTGRLAESLARFTGDGGRVACIGDHGVEADTVAPDNRGGAERAIAHLWELGHRRIGVVAGPSELITVRQRLAGVRRALEQRGQVPDADCTVEADFTRAGGGAAARELFGRRPDLTAVLALNDGMAVGALAALRDDLGRSVPEEVSVIGFDDLPCALDVRPALTTVRVPLERTGARAMDLILADVADGTPPRTVDVEVDLVVRESTGPVRG
ncbi:LacI family DNA-binding transcriptional regulator [Kitasatospora sp. NPDC049285]|uniref:LacI family DNA-binding transcriptional regulator n=1 Tax=Kitasatospora sp. NPDC049285 TaxID=3157096 RepID=UPI0034215A5D